MPDGGGGSGDAGTPGDDGGTAGTPPPSEQVLATDDGYPDGLAIDASEVFWISVREEAAGKVTSTIKAMPKNGGAVRTVTTADRAGSSILVDDQFVYFETRNQYEPLDTIWRAPKNGGQAMAIATSAIDEFALDGDAIYYLRWIADGDYRVMRARKDGTSPVALATSAGGIGLALGFGRVFFVSHETIAAVPTQGGPIETVVTGVRFAQNLRVNDGWVVYREVEGTQGLPYLRKRVMRVSPSGGAPQLVAEMGSGVWPWDLDVNNGVAYWTEPESIGRAPLNGTAQAEHFGQGGYFHSGVRVDDTDIYFIRGRQILRMAK